MSITELRKSAVPDPDEAGIKLKSLIETILHSILDFPQMMHVSHYYLGDMYIYVIERRGEGINELGRLIGRDGRTLHSIRWLVHGSSRRYKTKAVIELWNNGERVEVISRGEKNVTAPIADSDRDRSERPSSQV